VDTGLGAGPGACPHCSWPLDRADDAEPEPGDEEDYLEAVLGDLPYRKTYRLLGGRLEATFRTLTVAEQDATHRQAQAEASQGKVQKVVDFYERVGRLQLALQIARVWTASRDVELPDGFTPRTAPRAGAFWEVDAPPGETGLAQVEEYVRAEVASQAPLYQALAAAGARFNRLVSRLTATLDSRDFSRPARTGS
jgi:hypothetical protein